MNYGTMLAVALRIGNIAALGFLLVFSLIPLLILATSEDVIRNEGWFWPLFIPASWFGSIALFGWFAFQDGWRAPNLVRSALNISLLSAVVGVVLYWYFNA